MQNNKIGSFIYDSLPSELQCERVCVYVLRSIMDALTYTLHHTMPQTVEPFAVLWQPRYTWNSTIHCVYTAQQIYINFIRLLQCHKYFPLFFGKRQIKIYFPWISVRFLFPSQWMMFHVALVMLTSCPFHFVLLPLQLEFEHYKASVCT